MVQSPIKEPMQANTRTVASHLVLIQGEDEIAAAKANNLYIEDRPVLIIRGIPASDTIRAVYALFSSRKDLTQHPFLLSRREKGIMMRNQWGDYSKITGRDFALFLEHWCVLVELGTFDKKPALIVMKKIPSMITQLFHQTRYITAEMLQPFEWLD